MEVSVSPPVVESRVIILGNGRRIGVAEFGAPDGIPVLAFHGAPASRLMFDVAHLAARDQGIRLIAFDRPGYGLSPLDYGATLKSRTETFHGLAEALGLDRFSVLGISGGGPYAVALAAELGRRVQALALVSPLGPVADVATRASEERVELTVAQRAFFLDLPRHPWVLRINAEIASRSFHAAPKLVATTFVHLLPKVDQVILARPEVSKSLIAMTLEAIRHGIGGGIADLEIYGEEWHVDFSAITAKARLWQGDADTIVPIAVAERLGQLIPGCEVTKVAGGGHFWVYDAIADLLGAVHRLAEAG